MLGLKVERKNVNLIPLVDMKRDTMGRVTNYDGIDQNYLYVICCTDGSFMRLWPQSGTIEPLKAVAAKDIDWQVEVLPSGSELTITVK